MFDNFVSKFYEIIRDNLVFLTKFTNKFSIKMKIKYKRFNP